MFSKNSENMRTQLAGRSVFFAAIAAGFEGTLVLFLSLLLGICAGHPLFGQQSSIPATVVQVSAATATSVALTSAGQYQVLSDAQWKDYEDVIEIAALNGVNKMAINNGQAMTSASYNSLAVLIRAQLDNSAPSPAKFQSQDEAARLRWGMDDFFSLAPCAQPGPLSPKILFSVEKAKFNQLETAIDASCQTPTGLALRIFKIFLGFIVVAAGFYGLLRCLKATFCVHLNLPFMCCLLGKRPSSTGLLNGIILSLMAVPTLFGQAADVVANFNSTNNPLANSAFSYGSGLNPSAFAPLPRDVPNCQGSPMDCRDTDPVIPYDGIVWWNGTAGQVQTSNVRQPNTVLRMDPQSVGSIVRFTAPSSGSYYVSGSYQGIDVRQQSVTAAVYVNGSQVFSTTISSFGQTIPFNLSLSLSAGQTIDFIVTRVGTYYDLSTGLSAVIAPQGYINPKYLIMGVTYAPPGGSASSVSYQNSNIVGNTSTNTSSFTNGVTASVSLTQGAGLFGFLKGTTTETLSAGWTQKTTQSNEISVTKTSATTFKTPGVPNVYSPVDHDYDIIWLWLNPVVIFTAPGTNTGASIVWNGYGYDLNDPLQDVDVWPVYVGYLNGDFGPLDPQDADALARSWATTQTFEPGQGPGITSADFPSILKADPFAHNPYDADSGYVLTLVPGTNPATSTDGRFTAATVGNSTTPQSVPYPQAPPNSTQGLQTTYQSAYSTATTVTQSSDYTYTVGFGVDTHFDIDIIAKAGAELKIDWKMTWDNDSQIKNSNTNTQTDTAVIATPPCPATEAPCSPEYTEPHEFAVYQDNLHGTFMFWPNPYFSIQNVAPAIATVGAGSASTFVISTLANAGYNGTSISFNVTGLPPDASFRPGTVAPGASFPLVVSTASATPNGTYPLKISASDGSQSYFASATLVISPSCTYSINHSSQEFASSAGSNTVLVSTGAGCGWTATTSANWITINSPVSGSASGTITYSVAANLTGLPRAASIVIGDQVLRITQTVAVTANGVYDDADPQIAYNGAWGSNSTAGRYNGTQTFSNEVGDTASLTFTGTQVAYVYETQGNMGHAQVSIDGQVVTPDLDEYSATTQAQMRAIYTGLSSGTHTITVSVLGTPDGGSSNSYVIVDAFIVGPAASIYDDGDPQITLAGNWGHNTATGRYNGTQTFSNEVGDTASLTFNGTQVAYVYETQGNMGHAHVIIDGQIVTPSLDEYSATTQSQKRAIYAGLSSGTHTISVSVVGTPDGGSSNSYVIVDAFIVGPAASIYDDGDPQITLTGNWGHNTADGRYNGTQTFSNEVGDTASLTFTGTQIAYIYETQGNMGHAQVMIDGQIVTPDLDEYSATTQSQKRAIYTGLSNGPHTISVSVLGAPDGGSSNSYVIVDAFIVGPAASIYDDGDPQMTYTGNWGHNMAIGRYDGTQTFSNEVGDTASLTFTGTQVAYVYETQSNMGHAQVTIDGQIVTPDLDEYSATPQQQQKVTFSGLSSGTHTISISVLGTADSGSSTSYVIIDAFIVGI